MTSITRNRAEFSPRLHALAVAGAALATLSLFSASAAALELTLPGNARETASRSTAPDSYLVPTGAINGSYLPSIRAEGRVSLGAWRVDAQGITTLQILAPLRARIEAAGYEILYECAAAECGGFAFRYRLDVLPEPEMHVDLFDYRYLAARSPQGEGGAVEYLALLASRTESAGFLQIARIAPPGTAAAAIASAGAPPLRPASKPEGAAPAAAGPTAPLDQRLLGSGHAILRDLTFETGSSSLGPGPFGSLEALAAFLLADPARQVALVGHTDAVGALDGNIALSKRRAASVLERLATGYGVPRTQMEAEGMGYLAPLTTNRTSEGREQNRRVEAILLNTD